MVIYWSKVRRPVYGTATVKELNVCMCERFIIPLHIIHVFAILYLFSQRSWTSLLMTPAGSVHGGAAFSSAVSYSSSRPSSCSVSPSLCPARRWREVLRANRPCCPRLYPRIMRNPSPAMESTSPTATICPAASISEVSVPVTGSNHYTQLHNR